MPRDDSSLEHTDVRAESVVEGSSTGHGMFRLIGFLIGFLLKGY